MNGCKLPFYTILKKMFKIHKNEKSVKKIFNKKKKQQLKVKIEDGRETPQKPGIFILCLYPINV